MFKQPETNSPAGVLCLTTFRLFHHTTYRTVTLPGPSRSFSSSVACRSHDLRSASKIFLNTWIASPPLTSFPDGKIKWGTPLHCCCERLSSCSSRRSSSSDDSEETYFSNSDLGMAASAAAEARASSCPRSSPSLKYRRNKIS